MPKPRSATHRGRPGLSRRGASIIASDPGVADDVQPERRIAPTIAFSLACLAILAFEALRVYWIMPFPGSQEGETLPWAYGLHRARWPVRVVLWGALIVSGYRLWAGGRLRGRILAGLGLIACGLVTWQANGPMSADAMFLEPSTIAFARRADTALPADALVLGVVRGGQPRAYPIRIIGYHHQVRDVLGGEPVMVTYCTVCRSGRVFIPVVQGAPDEFRLVGMDGFNAMFEDSRTRSWWRQATGEAVAGPLKGTRLEEVPSEQASWGTWLVAHPDSDVLEPDPAFADRYERLPAFEQGTNESALTGRDDTSWAEKSWIVGVLAGDGARAFDWNELVESRAIADRVGEVPVALLLAADGVTFRAFDARWPGGIASLEPTDDPRRFVDAATGTTFSDAGVALDGEHAGARLQALPAYQEFWHSWRTFHPGTSVRKERP